MKAREALKKARRELETSPSATQPSLFSTISPQSESLTVVGPNTPIRTENEGVSEAGPSTEMPSRDDGDFSPHTSRYQDVMQEFVEEWVTGLDHDDKKAVDMLLCFTLVTEDAFTETAATQTATNLYGNLIELFFNGVLISSLMREHSLKG